VRKSLHTSVSERTDTNDMARAEVSANPTWISIEHKGLSGESLTAQQMASTSELSPG
jgi:hypothetical protein